MVATFTPCLPSALRRRGAPAMPFFHIVDSAQIYRFSVNFLRFPRFFEGGALLKKSLLFRSFFFAPSREINQVSPRAVRLQVVHAKARRRKGNERLATVLGVTHDVFNGSFYWMTAFAIMRRFRMAAVIATLDALPLERRRW
jgi:hypothetical protein